MKRLALALVFASALCAQQRVTEADYVRAQSMLQESVDPLLDDVVSSITWHTNGRVTWQQQTVGKKSYYSLDPATGAKSVVEKKEVTPDRDPDDGSLSPDGHSRVFTRDWNLWLRDDQTKRERQLTKDGTPDYGYATDHAGWKHTDKAIVAWSPDGKRIATFRQDQRRTGEMYLVSTNVGHPKLDRWKYPLPGDRDVTMIERVVIEAESGVVTKFNMPPDQHRSSVCDDVACTGTVWTDVTWSPDAKHITFVSTSRDHKDEWVREADASNGKVSELFHEHAATYFESGSTEANWRTLPRRNEVLWFSERDGWGQLYLYDAMSGALKKQLTHGEGNITRILSIDAQENSAIVEAVGREPNRDPYFRFLYRLNLNDGSMHLLTPEDADHEAAVAPDGQHFIDSYSTPDTPPVTVLRDAEGRITQEIAHTNATRLRAAGWVPPTPITTVARDGKTALYGLLFKPSHFDTAAKYPLIDHIYPGPQTGSVGTRSFRAARRDSQAMAELGFVVLELDGMGTPLRSKAFHDAYFGRMEDNTLPDQVASIQQLAAKYPWIDVGRVGIWGHSGGGYATADAMFRYPDLFKVGVAESGNHDQRNYEDDWAEKWIGLLNGSNYDAQANASVAKNLRGHLLLVHGTADDNVPPSNTLLVADALIRANRDFDMLMIPNARHAYGEADAFARRKRWDYFVRWLMGAEPPPWPQE